MPLDRLTIRNFKGIEDKCTFDLKPITLLIGPNSSGKSSCIHALAALAQTIKLTGSRRSVVLDDEYAQVHLGRFIEVIHSKSYADSMEIGIASDKIGRVPRGRPSTTVGLRDEPFEAIYCFKSTKRTQDVFIERAEFAIGAAQLSYRINPKNLDYTVRLDGKVVPTKAVNAAGLRFEIGPGPKGKNQKEFFDTFMMSQILNNVVSNELRQTLYLGPFRRPPERRYPTRGASPLEVGAQGEAAVTLLANEYVQSKSRPHTKQIGAWLGILGLAKSVEVSRVGKSDQFDVNVTLTDDAKLPIADLGYGVSQILPVLAQCSFAEKGATLLFEQPELHLHPGAARKLATVFASVAKQKNFRIVAETHSRELFVQVLHELREGNLQLDDIAAYKVARIDGRSAFERIKIEVVDGHVEVYDPWDGAICNIQAP